MKITKSLIFTILIITFIFCNVLSNLKAEESVEESKTAENVVDLTNKTFETFVTENQYVLVEFYVQWCGHCKAFKPEYEKLGDNMAARTDINVKIARVECDENKDLAEKYKIPGFPMVKLFKDGKPYKEYENERTAAAVEAWLEKKLGPVAQALKTQEELKKFIEEKKKSSNAPVVAYFKNRDSENYKLFINAIDSESLSDFFAGEVIESEFDDLKVESEKVELHLKGDDKVLSFEFNNVKEDAEKELVSFIKDNGFPLVDEVDAKSFRRFVEAQLPLAILFVDFNNEASKEENLKLLEPVASKLKGKFSFGISDSSVYGEQLEMMGGDSKKTPAIAAMKIEERKNFPYSGPLEEEKILEWANGILSGEIEPHLRSEPIPDQDESEPVKVIVGKTFDSIVLDQNKDVLLEFYAPWCGHCQKLEPKFIELGKYFKNVDNLVIAKIDATQNDTPIDIQGFPTIMLFRGSNKEPLSYEGNRSLSDLIKFIRTNADVSKEQVDKVEEPAEVEQKQQETGEEKKHEEL